MAIDKLEALAEGVVDFSGYRNPEGKLYAIRNPGGLKAWCPTVERDAENYRVFDTYKGGFHALLVDLTRKCNGSSHTRLKKTSTLKDLMSVNGFLPPMAKHVAGFLRKALQDQTISENTPLSYFIKE